MSEKLPDQTAFQRRKKSHSSFIPLLLLIVGVSAAVVFLYHFLQSNPAGNQSLRQQNGETKVSATPQRKQGDSPQQFLLESSTASTPLQTESGTPLESSGHTALESTPDGDAADGTEEMSRNVSAASEVDDYVQASEAVRGFYRVLDQQQYIKDVLRETPSQNHFSQLIQKLLDTPPVVSGETNDLFTILQNTAHFFRVMGEENIVLARTILAREKDQYEVLFARYYTLIHQPAHLQETFAITLDKDALYDYAGYFLTTMGGRLYLFRRDPVLRMLISYYSILLVDEANSEGRNRHGIDLRPPVDTLINEIETSGVQLKMRQRYLDNLYDIKEKYL